MLNIVATIKAKPGKEKQVKDLLTSLAMETHKEPGCHLYQVNQSANDSHYFLVVEKWAGEADLQAHLATPHIQTALKIKDNLLDHFEINPLVPLCVGHPSKENF